jgi:hypothetical protein
LSSKFLASSPADYAEKGDLNPSLSGNFVLQGKVPRSPLRPRTFKFPE